MELSPAEKVFLRLLAPVAALLLVALLLLGSAHGQVRRDAFAPPPAHRQSAKQSAKALPIVGKTAGKFMSKHPRLTGFLGNVSIGIEWDKPRKIKTEKTK